MTMKSMYITALRQLLIFLILSFSFTSIQAEIIEGKIISIADGDTLTLLISSKQQVKIRLASIDTPEKSQPFGNKAKQALAALVFQKYVTVDIQTKDRYGRSVGRVYIQELDVNAELVKQGYAWVYLKYSNDQNLLSLEAEARSKQRGLWSSDKPIPPWKWRKDKRTVKYDTQAAKGMIIGNINSRVYHLAECPSYTMVSPKNRVLFKHEALAVADGFRKASNCP